MSRVGRWLCPESWLILLLCGVDLTTTLLFLRHELAQEGNPIMDFYLKYGIGAFVGAKLVLVAAPILIIEWGRRHRPVSVRWLARAAVIGYIGIYGVLFLRVNVPSLMAAPANPPFHLQYSEPMVGEAVEEASTPDLGNLFHLKRRLEGMNLP